ncbi:DUF2178 domain-containing protein [Salimicrobium halophilum]|uniref:DUF2178 domain-containing protein n=1 Tax=Salimicrobium halophilum TaxID=86666 RepID=A0A1G8SHP6_9BACI|nr:DUF2178 domain-containing protein [Salimicrobium halophilum]SDJ28683.1 hypothetical protein SAMN04490247_1466 [Salimicrobium halophilum]
MNELTESLFQPLRTWAEISAGNWNILIVGGFVLFMISIGVMFMCWRMIGEEDERTKGIYLQSAAIAFLVLVLCDILFPKEYMWQVFFLFKYSFAFLAGGIYLATRYLRDRTV